MLRAPCAAGRSPDRGPGQSGFEVSSPISSISPAPPGLAWGGVRSGPKRRLNCSGQSLVVSSPLGFLLSPPESLRGQSQDIPACWSSSNWETGKKRVVWLLLPASCGKGKRRCLIRSGNEGTSGERFLQRMEETPSFPPASFPYKEEIPPSALRCGSGQWRMGQATARATGFPGDGVTDSVQEEKRVKMGGQMKIPMGMWGRERPYRPPSSKPC